MVLVITINTIDYYVPILTDVTPSPNKKHRKHKHKKHKKTKDNCPEDADVDVVAEPNVAEKPMLKLKIKLGNKSSAQNKYILIIFNFVSPIAALFLFHVSYSDTKLFITIL